MTVEAIPVTPAWLVLRERADAAARWRASISRSAAGTELTPFSKADAEPVELDARCPRCGCVVELGDDAAEDARCADGRARACAELVQRARHRPPDLS